jgi:hypothetical protein
MSRKIYIYDKSLGRLVRIKQAPKRRNVSGHWPMASESMAVRPEQIATAQAKLREKGVQTEYEVCRNSKGVEVCARPILRDRSHKKAHMRALGWYDGDAGYGDASPVNFVGSSYENPNR